MTTLWCLSFNSWWRSTSYSWVPTFTSHRVQGGVGVGTPLQLLICFYDHNLVHTAKVLGWRMFCKPQILSKNVFFSKNRNLPFLFFLVLSYWGMMDLSAFKYFLLPCILGDFSLDSIYQCYNCPLSLLQSINSFKLLSSHSFSTSSYHMCSISLQPGFISTAPLNLIFPVNITSVLDFVYPSIHFSLAIHQFIWK